MVPIGGVSVSRFAVMVVVVGLLAVLGLTGTGLASIGCDSYGSDQSCCTTDPACYFSGGTCRDCTSCTPGLSYQTEPCTQTTDRVCAICTPCLSPILYETSPCTLTSDRTCALCTQCGAGQYKQSPCGATSDTVCGACDVSCAECSGPSDTECTSCASGFVLTGGGCVRAADHYACYEAKTKDFRATSVTLADQFATITARADKLDELCPPVDKNGEGIANADAHLTCYALKDVGKSTKRTVAVDNQFGAQLLTVKEPQDLCLPAIKSVSGPASGDPGALGVNHFLCYKAEAAPPRSFVPPAVSLVDQFAVRNATAKKPVSFCTPVDKNSEGTIVDASSFLVCYELDKQPPVNLNVSTLDQFGGAGVTVQKPDTLCVPSTLLP